MLMTIFIYNFPLVLLGIKFFSFLSLRRKFAITIFSHMAFIFMYSLTWNLGMELSGQKLVDIFITLSC